MGCSRGVLLDWCWSWYRRQCCGSTLIMLSTLWAGFWLLLAFNSFLAYFVNLTNFLVTKYTSALTLQVGGAGGWVSGGVEASALLLSSETGAWQTCLLPTLDPTVLGCCIFCRVA
jgi:hypothetical protein